MSRSCINQFAGPSAPYPKTDGSQAKSILSNATHNATCGHTTHHLTLQTHSLIKTLLPLAHIQSFFPNKQQSYKYSLKLILDNTQGTFKRYQRMIIGGFFMQGRLKEIHYFDEDIIHTSVRNVIKRREINDLMPVDFATRHCQGISGEREKEETNCHLTSCVDLEFT